MICRLDDDPARNAERWKKMPQMASYQEVGEAKPGATTLLKATPAGKAKMLVTNFHDVRSCILPRDGTYFTSISSAVAGVWP